MKNHQKWLEPKIKISKKLNGKYTCMHACGIGNIMSKFRLPARKTANKIKLLRAKPTSIAQTMPLQDCTCRGCDATCVRVYTYTHRTHSMSHSIIALLIINFGYVRSLMHLFGDYYFACYACMKLYPS